jgi:hypothetical protein
MQFFTAGYSPPESKFFILVIIYFHSCLCR